MQEFITLETTIKILEDQVLTPQTELITLSESFQRILAEDVFADRDYPPFNRSAMDGIAIHTDSFKIGGINKFEIIGEIFAGDTTTETLKKGTCFRIMTGAAVPSSANAVIKIEDCMIKERIAEIINPSILVKPFYNIAKQGEDILKGNTMLEKHTFINPTAMSALASVGKAQIEVFKKPKVGILTSGDEIVEINKPVKANQIRNSNSFAIIGLLSKMGIRPNQNLQETDNPHKLLSGISSLLENDIVILTGGVSMGAADYIPQVLKQLGVEALFHKVKIKPGKPIWVGKKDQTYVFALPGNPMSVQTTFKVFLEPFLNSWMGNSKKNYFYLPLGKDKTKKAQLDEFFTCRIEPKETTILPINTNGSGDIISSIPSDGIALHPIEEGDLEKGKILKFYPW